MMTSESKKERKAQAKDSADLNQKMVEKHNQEYAEQHPEKRYEDHQHTTCTRCGFELYTDEDSEFDGKDGRMHHVSRCLELALAAISRMKAAGAKDPEEKLLSDKEKEKQAAESKQKSIEENMAARGEIVAGRNREPWEIELEEKGGAEKVAKEKEAASKKAAEKKSQGQKVEAQKKEDLPQDKRADEISGEKEHQDSQVEKAK